MYSMHKDIKSGINTQWGFYKTLHGVYMYAGPKGHRNWPIIAPSFTLEENVETEYLQPILNFGKFSFLLNKRHQIRWKDKKYKFRHSKLINGQILRLSPSWTIIQGFLLPHCSKGTYKN